MQRYLAYGSNLHPLRLAERVPSSRLLGTTRLERYSVAFVKRSMDGSAKCTLQFTDSPADHAHCAVYELDESERHLLDQAEGLGSGYDEATLRVEVGGGSVTAFTYIADASHLAPELLPYDWYRTLVIEGARFHGFPEACITRLVATRSLPDPDRMRRFRHEELLVRIRDYGP